MEFIINAAKHHGIMTKI